MPTTSVYFYQDEKGNAPVFEWLRTLFKRDKRAYAKCIAAIRFLSSIGYELRRPQADYLRDGIYELRIRKERIHYRILYFFHGKDIVILTHAITKKGKVPEFEIDRTISRKKLYETNPEKHKAEMEIQNAENKGRNEDH